MSAGKVSMEQWEFMQSDVPDFDEGKRTYIALGSNEGNLCRTLLDAALRLVTTPGISFRAMSPLYRSEPAYREDQAAFANAVIEVGATMSPLELLDRLHQIEDEFGRMRTVPNGPRTLDLDIVDMEDTVCATPMLTLPHPGALERDFVVTPLCYLAQAAQMEDPLLLADGTPVTRDGIAYGTVTDILMDAHRVRTEITTAERAYHMGDRNRS